MFKNRMYYPRLRTSQNLIVIITTGLINTEIDKYNKVNMSELMRVAKKYFLTDKMVVLSYVPKGYKE